MLYSKKDTRTTALYSNVSFANSSSSSTQILSTPPPPTGSFLSVYHDCVNLRPLRFVTLAVWNADVPIARLSLLISLHHPTQKPDGQCVPKKWHSSYVKLITYLNKEIQIRDIQKSNHIDSCHWCLYSLHCCYSCADSLDIRSYLNRADKNGPQRFSLENAAESKAHNRRR